MSGLKSHQSRQEARRGETHRLQLSPTVPLGEIFVRFETSGFASVIIEEVKNEIGSEVMKTMGNHKPRAWR